MSCSFTWLFHFLSFWHFQCSVFCLVVECRSCVPLTRITFFNIISSLMHHSASNSLTVTQPLRKPRHKSLCNYISMTDFSWLPRFQSPTPNEHINGFLKMSIQDFIILPTCTTYHLFFLSLCNDIFNIFTFSLQNVNVKHKHLQPLT